MPRVIILHASVGSGHQSAARALAEEFSRRPDWEVRMEDTLSYANPLFRSTYQQAYLGLSERAPLIWQEFYKRTDKESVDYMSSGVKWLVTELGVPRLAALIKRFAPQAIICTHFLPVELLHRLRQGGTLQMPIYMVITDHAVHSQWIMPGVDGYFVASELPRQIMVARGVVPSIIYISGIPVKHEVAIPKQQDEMRLRHGLASLDPVITLFGGGLSASRVRQIIEDLLVLDLPGTVVVIAGRNRGLPAALAGLGDGPQMKLRLFEDIAYVDDIVVASDLLISKAGGLIVSEVLARGRPMIVIDPIPGHEAWNADYLVSTGAGLRLQLAEWVPWAVAQLLSQSERLDKLSECARSAAYPHAARDIAEHVAHELRIGRNA